VALLKRLTYGAGGYFWGYDSRAVQVFQGTSEERIGEDFSGYQDPKGVYAIRELVRAGQDGSHYVHYSFTLPGSSQIVPKIGYAHYLPKWNLVFGTSLNLDDIERDVQKAREAFQARINDLMLIMLGSALALLVAIALVALPTSNAIVRPLLRIKANLDDMAAGDGNLTHRLPVNSRDELGNWRPPSTVSSRRSMPWSSRWPAPPSNLPGWSLMWPSRRSVRSRPWATSAARPTRWPRRSTR
jgi:methyl-accepting chemotaxis protein